MTTSFPETSMHIAQDNAKPHCAHITKAWLWKKRMGGLDSPACRPDLVTIENMWRILKRKNDNRDPVLLHTLRLVCRKNGTKRPLKWFITWCLESLNVCKVLWKGMATLQSGKCFTVPTFFEIFCKIQNCNKCLFWKNNTIQEFKHQIMCLCIVYIVIQVKERL